MFICLFCCDANLWLVIIYRLGLLMIVYTKSDRPFYKYWWRQIDSVKTNLWQEYQKLHSLTHKKKHLCFLEQANFLEQKGHKKYRDLNMFVVELLQFLEPNFRVETGSAGRDDFADGIETSGTEIFFDPAPIFPEEIPGKISTDFVAGNSGNDARKVLLTNLRRI